MTTESFEAAHAVAERLKAAEAAFRGLQTQLREAIDGIRKSDALPETCRAYKALSDGYDAMDAARKTIYADLESMSRETIPEMLAEAGVTNITVEIGDLKYRFGKSQRVSVSMTDKEAGMDWLKANGGEGLIKPTVNAAQLSSFAKEFLKTKGMDLPLDQFKTSSMTYTSITKA